MKILHTSDWHIGSTFYGKKRYEEFSLFFAWLLETINTEKIDVLLVSGDIFDTALPSNTAQQIYYSFLISLRQSCCRHAVITGGNHDSPSFLNAPKQLLKTLDIHVVGAAQDKNSGIAEETDEELLKITVENETVYILAVPYLRERDLQGISITDSHADRAGKIAAAIKNHYARLAEKAAAQKQPGEKIIAMGHLYAAGASLEEEGERELYMGSLAQISAAAFPPCLDYIALGHIHTAQKIGGSEHIRYCGSPLAMNFSEKNTAKKILIVDTAPQISIKEIPVPEFQITRKIRGDFSHIRRETEKLKALQKSVWLEVEYTGEEEFNLKDSLNSLTENSSVEILKFKNQNLLNSVLGNTSESDCLEDVTPLDIFKELLKNTPYSEENKQELEACYREILNAVQEDDINA